MSAVVVTGMGLITGLGRGVTHCFERVIAGESAASRVERFAREGLDNPVAAPSSRDTLDRDAVNELPFVSALIVTAARDALADARLTAPLDDTPLLVANTIGSPAACERPGGWHTADPASAETLQAYGQGPLVAQAAEYLGARGRVDVLGNTCAAGNYAIGIGADLIRRGEARRVLVGGAEELSILPFTAFSQLRAIGDPCRPFDEARDGMLFGEGAAMLVLEELGAARARGVEALAEVASVAYSNDAYHLVAPDPTGAGLERALRSALTRANAESVDYVNAHGTGTELNDATEAQALHRVLGRGHWLSSTKGATGHCMGAAAAVEAVLTIESMRRGRRLPSVGLNIPDPAVPSKLVRDSEPGDTETAVSVSLGFGGNDAVLVLRRAPVPCVPPSPRAVYLRPGAAWVGSARGVASVEEWLKQNRTVDARAEFDAKALLGRKGLRHADRGALLFAAAMRDTRWDPTISAERLGTCVGGSYPAYASIVAILQAFQRGGPRAVPPMLVPFATVNCASSWWMMREGLKGFNGCPVSGDCAGLDAVQWAAERVAANDSDAILAGASEGYSEALWRGLGGEHFEAAAAVFVQHDVAGAKARWLRSARAFDRQSPTAAQRRALDALRAGGAKLYAARQGIERARVVPGDALAATGVLALHWAMSELEEGERAAVVSDSRDGFATAVLIEHASG